MPPLNDHRDGPRDECGVFGIYAPEHDVARLAYFALFALQLITRYDLEKLSSIPLAARWMRRPCPNPANALLVSPP